MARTCIALSLFLSLFATCCLAMEDNAFSEEFENFHDHQTATSDNFLEIELDLSMTRKVNRMNEVLYERFGHDGSQLCYDSTQDQAEPRYCLLSRRKGSFRPTGPYIYVVINNADGEPELRVGQGGHYFLSSKAAAVLAAGEIVFADGLITMINDSSGAYHIARQDPQLEAKRESIHRVLKAVGLPVSKFQWH